MSIFQKKEIRVGDLVIGLNKYGWDNKGAASLHRYFSDPVMVLEIKSGQALLYFEQQGPQWYDINKLERVYVTEEFTDKDAVQDTFYQQRGFTNNKLGETKDIRELQKRDVLTKPITGPKEISSDGNSSKAGNAFYDES